MKCATAIHFEMYHFFDNYPIGVGFALSDAARRYLHDGV